MSDNQSDSSSKKTAQCIRCDEEVSTARPSGGWDYVPLPFNQQTGALPICKECFEGVKPRDVWR